MGRSTMPNSDADMARLGAVVGLAIGVIAVLFGAPLWALPVSVVANMVLAVLV